VPAVFDAEVFAALRRIVCRRLIDPEQAQVRLLVAARLGAARHSLTKLLPEAFALARAATGYVDVVHVTA